MKYIFTLTIIFFSLSISAQTNFDRGFANGYKKGFCHDQGISCIEPLPPIAPIPNVNESSSSYTDGYNRGFELGLEARDEKSTTEQRSGYKTSKSEFVDKNTYNPLQKVDMNNLILLAKALRESKELALEYLEEKKYQAVADICVSGLRVNPNDDEFMLLLGQAFRLSGDEKNGLKWLKKASRRRPNDKNLKKLIRSMKE